MKTMLYSLALVAMILPFSACSDNDDPILTQKDWEGKTEYFAPTDEKLFGTYYKPYVGYVGDPMPFYDPVAKDFKVLYLQDYRPNPADTYHPIWGLSTKNCADYTSLGELIHCGEPADVDAAIGTGSTVYDEGTKLYYTFYTGHTSGREVVTVATSSDFKTWTKDKSLYLKGEDYGYSRSDFRDPFVFKGDDGVYHMLVSTMQGTKGVIAEFTSADLKTWESKGVFMTAMWDRFYECPDVFKMGDWWYLVYSEKHSAIRKVQYFKGRTLDEIKAATANDAGIWPDDHEGFLDTRAFYAGKTASDGTDRYIWGWCPTRAGNNNTDVGAAPNEPEWAGNLVCHKLIQNADGTLTLGPVAGIDAKYTEASEAKAKVKSKTGVTESNGTYTLTGDAYVLFSRLKVHNKISFTVKTTGKGDRFGVSLVRGSDSDKYYTLAVDAEDNDNKRRINLYEEGTAGMGLISGMDSYAFPTPSDNTYNVTIYTDNSVCVTYINNVVVSTQRLYGIQKNCWSFNSYGGTVELSNLSVSCY